MLQDIYNYIYIYFFLGGGGVDLATLCPLHHHFGLDDAV